jgi:hypothetical protein
MVDERAEKCKWWKKQMVEEGQKMICEITTGLFS